MNLGRCAVAFAIITGCGSRSPATERPTQTLPKPCAEAPPPPAGSGKRTLRGADFNGDGFADLAFQSVDAVPDNQQEIVVFFGSSAGLARAVGQRLPNPESDIVEFGHRLSTRDMSGDGISDLVVVSVRADGSRVAFAYLGSKQGLSANALVAEVPPATRVDVDDFDGDGVGERYQREPLGVSFTTRVDSNARADDRVTLPSCLLPIPGFPDGIDHSEAKPRTRLAGDGCFESIPRPQCAHSLFEAYWAPLRDGPWSVAGEDITGDGRAELVALVGVAPPQIGSPKGKTGAAYVAHLFVYRGSPGGVQQVPFVRMPLADASGFRSILRGVGDINGDGFGDVLVAFQKANWPVSARLTLLYGSAKGFVQPPQLIAPPRGYQEGQDRFGSDIFYR